jgi:hypothetical protein
MLRPHRRQSASRDPDAAMRLSQRTATRTRTTIAAEVMAAMAHRTWAAGTQPFARTSLRLVHGSPPLTDHVPTLPITFGHGTPSRREGPRPWGWEHRALGASRFR